MLGQPGFHYRMVVGGVVVENEMKVDGLGRVAIDCTKKPEEFLVTMTRQALPDDAPIQGVERSEQRRRPVAFVVMRHGLRPAWLHRQPRLRTIKCLNLALLVDTEHQSMFRRIEIQPNNILEFINKPGVPAQLEGPYQVRFQPVLFPYALYTRRTQTYLNRHAPRAPVRGVSGLLPQCLVYHRSHPVFVDPLLTPRTSPVLKQAGYPKPLIALPPTGDRRRRSPKLAHDLACGCTIGRQQRNASPQGHFLHCVSIPCYRLKHFPIPVRNHQSLTGSHDQHYIITNSI